MRSTWADPEYAVLFEVGEKTGGAGRRADALIMGLWPSRGLELHGVEIKVSRADWKREAAAPQKAEAIAKFCDRWYVHTAPGVVADLAELPPTWGLREWDGKRWRTVREATKLNAEPISRSFLAALLRKADRNAQDEINSAINARMQKEREQAEAEIERRVANAKPELARLQNLLAELCEALGLDPVQNTREWATYELKEIAKIAGMLKRSGAVGDYQSLSALSSSIRKIANNLDTEIAKIGATQ